KTHGSVWCWPLVQNPQTAAVDGYDPMWTNTPVLSVSMVDPYSSNVLVPVSAPLTLPPSQLSTLQLPSPTQPPPPTPPTQPTPATQAPTPTQPLPHPRSQARTNPFAQARQDAHSFPLPPVPGPANMSRDFPLRPQPMISNFFAQVLFFIFLS